MDFYGKIIIQFIFIVKSLSIAFFIVKSLSNVFL